MDDVSVAGLPSPGPAVVSWVAVRGDDGRVRMEMRWLLRRRDEVQQAAAA